MSNNFLCPTNEIYPFSGEIQVLEGHQSIIPFEQLIKVQIIVLPATRILKLRFFVDFSDSRGYVLGCFASTAIDRTKNYPIQPLISSVF